MAIIGPRLLRLHTHIVYHPEGGLHTFKLQDMSYESYKGLCLGKNVPNKPKHYAVFSCTQNGFHSACNYALE